MKAKLLREGMTNEELMIMVSSIMGKHCNAVDLKFTVKFDCNTFIDLVDNEGVDQLIRFNDDFAHVFVSKNANEMEETRMDHLEGIEDVTPVSIDFGYSGEEESPSLVDENALPCATQSLPAPLPELNSCKWNNLFLGVGQTFSDADTFRLVLFKYGIVNNFGYTFVKNSPSKMIVKCKFEGCK